MNKFYLLAFIILTWTANISYKSGYGTPFTNCGQPSCHTTNAAATKVDSIVLIDPVTSASVSSYKPNTAYTIKIYGQNTSGLNKFGFQVTNSQKGAFSNPSANTKITTLTTWLWEQSTAISGTSGNFLATATWTSPAAGSTSTQFEAYLNAVNDNSNQNGDAVSAKFSTTVSEQTGTSQDTAKVSIALTSGTLPSKVGSSLTFTATATNGGSNPQFQWKVNGNNIGTASSVNTYTTTTLKQNDSVSCVLTSNLAGVIGSPATSNKIKISTIGNPVRVSTAVVYDLNLLYTNTENVFKLNSKSASKPVMVELYNLSGKKCYSNSFYANDIIDLNSLTKGIYILHLKVNNEIITKKLSIL